MSSDKQHISTTPYNLASLIRGLYGRVARQLKVDPSYVSRVARGERQSGKIEASLERELKRILALVRTSRNGANHNGTARRARQNAKKHSRAKRVKKSTH